MYERTLAQILQVLRRIRCLTYAMVLITATTLVLYLLHDVMSFSITSGHAVLSYNPQQQFDLRIQSENSFVARVRKKPTRECTPQKNIIFTKTHKTGSSTITNILLRYGEINNLTQLLYSYPSSTEYRHLDDKRLMRPGMKANIFSQHAFYDPTFLRDHIKEGAKTFTIIRSPLSQFLSAYSFFGKDRLYPAQTFEESVKLFFRSHGHERYLKDKWFCKNCGNLVNANAFDMGFSAEEFVHSRDKDQFMQRFLEQAAKSWDLVLITEYFDLSLVLLKRRFCLEYKDILYLRSLERAKKETVEEPYTLAAIKEIQRIDQAIYTYFNNTFWAEVAKEDGIFEELAIFQKLNKQVQSFCVEGSKVGYLGTVVNVLTPQGRENFHCLAMNTRCLLFSTLLEARDDEKVTEDTLEEVRRQYDDPDSLNYEQIAYLDRDTDIISLSLGG